MPAKLTRKDAAKKLDKIFGKVPRDASAAISRMPRKVRDAVSTALIDGASWRAVSKICAAAGFEGVTAQNVTNYRQGDHQKWLEREERMEVIRRDSEATSQIMRHYVENGGSPAEAGLLASAEIMSNALVGLGPESIQILIADDPKALFGITRELARVAELLGKRRDAAAATTPDAAPVDTMTEDEKAAMVVKLVDQALFSKK